MTRDQPATDDAAETALKAPVPSHELSVVPLDHRLAAIDGVSSMVTYLVSRASSYWIM